MDAVVFTLLEQLRPSQSELFATIFWSLWKRRNLKLWQQKHETSMQVVERETHMLDDWREAHVFCGNASTSVIKNQPNLDSQDIILWEKPARGWYKCNIDASFSASMNKLGIGMCIRDAAGEIFLAKTSWFSPLCNVDIGEAVGLRIALEWTSDLQFDNIDFALNSKKIVDAFRTCIEDSSEFDCIIDAYRQLFQSRFQNSHVEFNMRQANGVAHELAP